jgi:hypothetical protein
LKLHPVGVLLLAGAVLSIPVTVAQGAKAKPAPPPQNPQDWSDSFSLGGLDSQRWKVTRAGDFKESAVDVVDVDPGKASDRRLRLRAGTLGTDDATVKFLGVRTAQPIDFKNGVAISFDLDWNDQVNGSYLTGAVYLCPTATGKNPQDADDWIRFEYVGVPPGRNARATIAAKVDGQVRWLFTEGWPEQNRAGRKIGRQHLTLQIAPHQLIVQENGAELYRTDTHGLDFTQAYLYLQMSSHSNYPAREIYFDTITVRPL